MMPTITVALAVLLLTGISTAQINFTSVLQLNSGFVRGQILTTVRKSLMYSSFTGIPFAKPPLGDLRFQPPEPIDNWKGVLDATKKPNICAQLSNEKSPSGGVIGSEDCLYLNVYTPKTDFEKLEKTDSKAVMVWIYGGGFMAGSQLSNTARPDFLLEDDVIVVSANYRLGPLGFLNLKHKNVSGNAGLKDQNLALRWVKENIAKFGGNPEKITIFGESAGAVSVDLHVVSDMSAGLFQQSISMSASPLGAYWSMQTNKEAMRHAFELGSKLGHNSSDVNDLIKVLQSASTNDIIIKAAELPWTPFRPTVEKSPEVDTKQKFLSSCVLNRYRDGKKINKGRHMMGFTSNEGKVFYYNTKTVLEMFEMTSELFEEAGIPVNLSAYRDFASSLKSNLSGFDKDQLQKNFEFFSDLYFVAGIDLKQQFLSKSNDEPIYYYRFAFEATKYIQDAEEMSALNPYNISGVGHAEDLLYTFYMPEKKFPIHQPAISLTIDRFVRLLTNFAKYGNPTPKNKQDELLNIAWPDSRMQGLHLEIGDELLVGEPPVTEETRFIQQSGALNSPLLLDC